MEVLNKFLNAESVQAIDKLLANIADTLNISVDMLKENGMQYVLEFGKYEFWSNFAIGGLFLGFLMLLVYFLLLAIFEDIFNSEVTWLLVPLIVVIIIWSMTMLFMSLPYIMSPEMYSIKKVIELLQ